MPAPKNSTTSFARSLATTRRAWSPIGSHMVIERIIGRDRHAASGGEEGRMRIRRRMAPVILAWCVLGPGCGPSSLPTRRVVHCNLNAAAFSEGDCDRRENVSAGWPIESASKFRRDMKMCSCRPR